MDKKLARHVAAIAIRSSTQLTSLVPLLKEHCEEAEYNAYAKAIASAAAHINADLLNVLFAQYPSIKKEIEAEIGKYGLVL